MNKDTITALAREVGLWPAVTDVFPNELERFAALVAAHEREECAKVCEETTASWTPHLYDEGCIDCAKAIRGRT